MTLNMSYLLRVMNNLLAPSVYDHFSFMHVSIRIHSSNIIECSTILEARQEEYNLLGEFRFNLKN